MREASMNDTFRVVWRGCFGEDAAMGISWRWPTKHVYLRLRGLNV
jgi:hypothetical protein